MPVQIGGELDGLDEVVRRFRQAPEVFERYMRQFMNRALPIIEREVKVKTPVNTGALRSSIGHEISGVGAQMQGIVGTSKEYAPFVELDTRPHWPPYRAIEYWAMRKLGLQGAVLRTAVRGIQRKIARAGTTGRHMFGLAFEATRERVRQMWADTWADAVKKEL
jgi:ribosome modulation factor